MILISNFLLWIFVVLLLVAVIALARQLHMLRERLTPVEAVVSTGNLRSGGPSPILSVHTLDGRVVTLGGRDDIEQSVLILFVSPGSPVCEKLIPSAMMLARAQAFRLIFVADGDAAACRDMVRAHRMLAYDVIESVDARRAYRVGDDPFAVLLNGDGSIASMGDVYSREQLQSLLALSMPDHAAVQESRVSPASHPAPALVG